MSITDPLEAIPAERLARYVEDIADILEAEEEEKVEDMTARLNHPYYRIWRSLEHTERLQEDLVHRVNEMAERLASNRRKRGWIRWGFEG